MWIDTYAVKKKKKMKTWNKNLMISALEMEQEKAGQYW